MTAALGTIVGGDGRALEHQTVRQVFEVWPQPRLVPQKGALAAAQTQLRPHGHHSGRWRRIVRDLAIENARVRSCRERYKVVAIADRKGEVELLAGSVPKLDA